jgi:hypothetical protein
MFYRAQDVIGQDAGSGQQVGSQARLSAQTVPTDISVTARIAATLNQLRMSSPPFKTPAPRRRLQ